MVSLWRFQGQLNSAEKYRMYELYEKGHKQRTSDEDYSMLFDQDMLKMDTNMSCPCKIVL